MLQWSALIDVLDLEGIGGNERVLSFFRSSAVLEFLPSLSRENLARSGRVWFSATILQRLCAGSRVDESLNSSYHQHWGGFGLSVSGKSELRQDNGRARARVGAKNDGVTAHWIGWWAGRRRMRSTTYWEQSGRSEISYGMASITSPLTFNEKSLRAI